MRKLALQTVLALLVPHAAAQDADLLLQIGQRLPGIGTVRLVGRTAVDDSGSWAVAMAYEPGCLGCGPLACMRDGVIVAERGSTLPTGYTIPSDAIGPVGVDLSASGELVLNIKLANGDSVILWEGWPVLAVGDALPSPDLPAGSVLSAIEGVRVADGGRLAFLGSAAGPGMGGVGFMAQAVVDSTGLVSLDVVAQVGQPIGLNGFVWTGLAGDDHHQMELSEDGKVIWHPWVESPFTSSSQPAIYVDETPVAVSGAPGPLPNSILLPIGAGVGIGANGWMAQLDVWVSGEGARNILLRDGAVVLEVGDPCPSLSPATYTSFDFPMRPLPGGDVFFSGSAGGYLTGDFDLGGHSFLQREHADGLRVWSAGFREGANSSPNGRFVTERISLGAIEGIVLLDRAGSNEDPCALPPDGLEPNESCAGAAGIDVGAWVDLSVHETNTDWYQVLVPAGGDLSALVSFDHDEADIDLRLWGGSCSAPELLDESASASDGERVYGHHPGPGVATFWVEVAVAPGSAGACGRYRLDLYDDPALPCSTVTGPGDDALEDGDRPDAAIPLSAGLYTDLISSRWDEDWFRISVPPGEELAVQVDVTGGLGVLVANLFENPNLRVALDHAFVFSLPGTLRWTNETPEVRDVWVGVETSPAGSIPDPIGCVTYDLDVRIEGMVGERFCPNPPNSTGREALLYALGSSSISAQDLRLRAFTVPNSRGLFLYGAGTQQIPLANGTLCVAPGGQGLFRLRPTIARHGVLDHDLDYSATPQGAGQILAGSTWNFQAWYRDPMGGGARANLSEAVSVTFVP